MNNNAELLVAVREMEKDGTLNRLREGWAGAAAAVVARFALAVLEQKAIGCPYSDSQPVYALPPVPQPVKVKLPTSRLRAGKIDCYSKDDIIESLKAAGVEMEE